MKYKCALISLAWGQPNDRGRDNSYTQLAGQGRGNKCKSINLSLEMLALAMEPGLCWTGLQSICSVECREKL